ncbi:sugar-binding protein [Alkalispirochaeta sphaeroplastigenens]|uniref:Probable sugar-binding periplasmic protein n=1 Tax=Alkalispirochaeta sphaeroplastigenens TaxID=1187066 RepID=A0A2S4JVV4_9SPIO|nr:ABC transporter substrate-binding protein [Alkalispirochaeta sphaeroplastigenens]POR03620.1 sugar-binding protein [Alkalispirochaeta sphaeroplastigenens]
MKKIAMVGLALLVATTLFAGGGREARTAEGSVGLTLGSWRTDDVQQINRLIAAFNEEHPNIAIRFDPTNPPDYNATLRLQLESGTGPDIFYARSYATGQDLFADGYMLDLSDQAFIASAYDEGARDPWQTPEGTQFAMPLMAVSHGVYYNVDLFNELGITPPATWDELLQTAQKIADAGYTPIANGLADEWDITEVLWMNIAPAFLGGREARLAYEAGTRPFNDRAMESVFAAVASLEPFLPRGYEAISYNDSKALFLLGDAAMWFDGSWTVSEFEASNPDFTWSVFAPPPPAGATPHITFHPDAGIAINPASPNIEAALTFLEWLSGPRASAVLGNELAGFFPMVSNPPALDNEKANAFLQLNEGRELDVRFPWPRLMSGDPSAYSLIQQGSIGVITGRMTPREAARALHQGVTSWYTP